MFHELSFSTLLNVFLTLSWCGALLTAPSVLLQRAGRPAAALSWLFALFALPALAVTAWWLIGRTHLRRKSRRRRSAEQRMNRSLQVTRDAVTDLAQQHQRALEQRSCLAPALPPDFEDSVFPATAGNCVSLLPDTRRTHQTWFELIDAASHHIHCLFYIWRDDRSGRALRDRLLARARQGVEVRILIDAVGSFGLPRHFFDALQQHGAQVARFMPIKLLSAAPTLNFRNHRKLLIADARHAWTGGVNVGDEYLAWQDIGIHIDGPGVSQLQEVFVDDWFFTTGEELSGSEYFRDGHSAATCERSATAICETIASGPHQAFNMTRDMVFLAVNQCRQRLWITTPYFIPGAALMMALRTAVYRGVDVRLYLPAQSDAPLVARASRVFYQELLAGGVRIFEYPGMLHAKSLLLDDDAVIIGSANLDVRSFKLNFEVSSFITQRQLNQALAQMMQDIEKRSCEVPLQAVQNSSTVTRLQDAVAHLLSPLL